MKNVERWLREQARPVPSPELDARVEHMFQQHAARTVSRKVPLWMASAACLACFLLGLGIQDLLPTHTPAETPLAPTTAEAPRPPLEGRPPHPELNAQLAPGPVFDWSGATEAETNDAAAMVVIVETRARASASPQTRS